jgi:hypothetical protein
MIPLLSLIGLGAVQAQNGCTFGWSADPDENAPNLPVINLPNNLGVGQVPYMEITISIETGCQERLEFNNIGFTQPGCNIIEYFNQQGQFLGVEDLEYPSNSTVIFDGSDLDGVPGTGGFPSGVNPASMGCGMSTVSGTNGTFPFYPDYGGSNVGGTTFPDTCEYFPGNCNNLLAGAERGQFIFFRNVRGLAPGVGSTADEYSYSPGAVSSTFRAVRIISVVERTSPIIMGPYEQNLCTTTPIILDNGPSDLAGDPRYGNAENETDSNDDPSTDGSLLNITANNPSRLTAGVNIGKIRALLCTESTDPYQGGPGSTLDLSVTGPGTGYLDADADGNGIGDIPNTIDPNNNSVVTITTINGTVVLNDFYGNFQDTIDGLGTSPTAMGSFSGLPPMQNSVYNYTTNPDFNDVPDLCGGPITTRFVDFPSRARQGEIYGSEDRDNAQDNGRIRLCNQITRRWTATDQFGNSAIWNQTIDIVDDYRNCSAVTSLLVSNAGSPYFETVSNPIVGTVTVAPQPTTLLDCSANNVYENSGFFTTTNYSTTSVFGIESIVEAPNAGFAFPVFTYSSPVETFDCSELNTLDGFSPSPNDNCGLSGFGLTIDDLVDYSLDGDFGDEDATNTALFFNNNIGAMGYVAPSGTTVGDVNDQDDDPSIYMPTEREFYNYNLLRRWVFEDNCGFRSIAQRIYQIRDQEAPMIPSVTVTVNNNGSVLNFVSPTLMMNTPAFGTTGNVKRYVLSTPINIVTPDCTPSINVDAVLTDNCAVDFLGVSYSINEGGAGIFGSTISTGVFSNGNTMIQGLPSEGEYTIEVSYIDPSDNVAVLEIPVTTSGVNDPLVVNNFLTAPIGAGNVGTVDFLDVAPYSNVISFLSNLCDIPTCIELVIESTDANGVPISDSGIFEVSTSPSLQLLGLASNNDPLLTFGCNDIGDLKSVTVSINAISNCNTATNPPSRNVNSGTSLLDSQLSNVTIAGSATPSFTIATTSIAAATGVPGSGSISVEILEASGTPSQTYDVTFVNIATSATGTISNINIASSGANPVVIPNLDAGTYTVTVSGRQSCSSQSATVIVNTTTPVGVTLDCPGNAFTNGTTSFSLLAGSGFTGISNFVIDVTVSGVTGSTLSGLPTATLNNGLSNFVAGSTPNTYTFSFATSGASAVTVPAGTPLINFQLDIPTSTPVNTTITIGTSGVAEQTSGSAPPVSLSLSPTSCSLLTANNGGGGTGNILSAGGMVRYIYCDGLMEGVQLELTGSSVPQQFKTTGSNGLYSFPATIPSGTSVRIEPNLSSFNPSNQTYDVNISDVTAILNLVLNSPPPTSPYQELAADYDGDGDIDNDDALMLFNQVTINNDPALYNQWVFVLATQPLSIFTNKPRSGLDTVFESSNYTATNNNIDFFAYKPGAVNQECAGTFSPIVRSTIAMVAEDQAIQKGEVYELDFNISSLEQLKALQTVLQYDERSVRPMEVIFNGQMVSNGMTAGIIRDGQIRLGAASSAATTLTAEEAVVTLRFEALKDVGSLRAIFQLEATSTSIAVDGNDETVDLGLYYNAPSLSATSLEVYGSAPNPFSTSTNINFSISEQDDVQLTVTDVTGKVVHQQTANYDAGQHQIELTAAQLKTTGILIYTITTSDTKYTDKLLLID